MPMGCPRCTDPDAPAAWTALTTTRVATLEQESHFSLQLTACTCGQPFAVVFTERIDWQGGEDDQTWLALPITTDERARLETCPDDARRRLLSQLGFARRFLVRAFPTHGDLTAWWRDGGWAIGPHD